MFFGCELGVKYMHQTAFGIENISDPPWYQSKQISRDSKQFPQFAGSVRKQ